MIAGEVPIALSNSNHLNKCLNDEKALFLVRILNRSTNEGGYLWFCYKTWWSQDAPFFWKSPAVLLRDFLASISTHLTTHEGKINMGRCPGKFAGVSLDWNFLVTLYSKWGIFSKVPLLNNSSNHFSSSNNCGTCVLLKKIILMHCGLSRLRGVILYQFHW